MPRITTSRQFYYVYVLESRQDGKRYAGYTHDLTWRLKQHEMGLVASTKPRRPLDLIYYEACLNKNDAQRRERYLKTTQGRRFIGLRLKEFIQQVKFKSRS